MTYLLLNNPKTIQTISEIAYDIPCKVNVKKISPKKVQFFIECNSKYWNLIEKRLLPFM